MIAPPLPSYASIWYDNSVFNDIDRMIRVKDLKNGLTRIWSSVGMLGRNRCPSISSRFMPKYRQYASLTKLCVPSGRKPADKFCLLLNNIPVPLLALP